MLKTTIIVCLLCLAYSSFSTALNVTFTDLSLGGRLNSVNMEPCDLQYMGNRCALVKGTNITIVMNFTLNTNSPTLTQRAQGVIFGSKLGFPALRGDACTQGAVTPACPIVAGQTYTYRKTFPILRGYPVWSLDVLFSLIGRGRNLAVVAKIPTKIANAARSGRR